MYTRYFVQVHYSKTERQKNNLHNNIFYTIVSNDYMYMSEHVFCRVHTITIISQVCWHKYRCRYITILSVPQRLRIITSGYLRNKNYKINKVQKLWARLTIKTYNVSLNK